MLTEIKGCHGLRYHLWAHNMRLTIYIRIRGGAQLVPVNPMRGASVKRWVVNSLIDLNNFRLIYYDEDEQNDNMRRRRY